MYQDEPFGKCKIVKIMKNLLLKVEGVSKLGESQSSLMHMKNVFFADVQLKTKAIGSPGEMIKNLK